MINDLICNTIKSNINLSDVEIAKILKKRSPKYFSAIRLDTLRRRVNVIRMENNLIRVKRDRGKIMEAIAKGFKENPETTNKALAVKVHFNNPDYTIRTIQEFINDFKHWQVEYPGGLEHRLFM